MRFDLLTCRNKLSRNNNVKRGALWNVCVAPEAGRCWLCVCVCGSEVRFCKTSRVTTLWLCSGWVQAHNPLGYGEEDKVVWLKNTCSDPHKQLKCSKVCVKHLLVSSWLAHGWILPTSQWKYIMLFLQQTWLEKFLRSPYKHLLLCRENRWRWRNFQGEKSSFDHHKHTAGNRPRSPWKAGRFAGTNSAGDGATSREKYLDLVATSVSALLKNIPWRDAYKCWNTVID